MMFVIMDSNTAHGMRYLVSASVWTFDIAKAQRWQTRRAAADALDFLGLIDCVNAGNPRNCCLVPVHESKEEWWTK